MYRNLASPIQRLFRREAGIFEPALVREFTGAIRSSRPYQPRNGVNHEANVRSNSKDSADRNLAALLPCSGASTGTPMPKARARGTRWPKEEPPFRRACLCVSEIRRPRGVAPAIILVGQVLCAAGCRNPTILPLAMPPVVRAGTPAEFHWVSRVAGLFWNRRWLFHRQHR